MRAHSLYSDARAPSLTPALTGMPLECACARSRPLLVATPPSTHAPAPPLHHHAWPHLRHPSDKRTGRLGGDAAMSCAAARAPFHKAPERAATSTARPRPHKQDALGGDAKTMVVKGMAHTPECCTAHTPHSCTRGRPARLTPPRPARAGRAGRRRQDHGGAAPPNERMRTARSRTPASRARRTRWAATPRPS